MASGNTLIPWTPWCNEPPAANYATPNVRNARPVLDFDDTTDESAVFSGVLPRHYAGGGITVTLHWMAASDTTEAHYCRWQAAFEAAAGQDMDEDGFATAKSAGGSPNATSGIETITEIAFANSEIDGLAAGGAMRLKVTRDADGTSGTDDVSGDAQLLAVEIRET
jgi:hypothetical protein